MDFKKDLLDGLGIEVTQQQLNQFDIYYQYLIEYNKIINLTRITEIDDVYYKHFYDSLTLANTIDLNSVKSLCDMGSGAGFPSIPLKIMFPNLNVTIVDSLNKRIVFLEKLLDKLEITDVVSIHDRIEHFALNHQSSFDVVTARALGNMSLIAEMGIPITKIKGKFVAYKGNNYEEELSVSQQGIKLLGGNVQKVSKYELPFHLGTRNHIVIEKIKDVKGYPRQFSVMNKKPL